MTGYEEDELKALSRLGWLITAIKSGHVGDKQIERFGANPDACLSDVIVESRRLPHMQVTRVFATPSGKAWYDAAVDGEWAFVVGDKVYPYSPVEPRRSVSVYEQVGFMGDVPVIVSTHNFSADQDSSDYGTWSKMAFRSANLVLLKEKGQGKGLVLWSADGMWNATCISGNRIIYLKPNVKEDSYTLEQWDAGRITVLAEHVGPTKLFLEMPDGRIGRLSLVKTGNDDHPQVQLSILTNGVFANTQPIPGHLKEQMIDLVKCQGNLHRVCKTWPADFVFRGPDEERKLPIHLSGYMGGGTMVGDVFCYKGDAHHKMTRWVTVARPQEIPGGLPPVTLHPAFRSVSDLFVEDGKHYYYGLTDRHNHKVELPV
jgi:hypothetical protein